jgi:acetyl esterase/lipase
MDGVGPDGTDVVTTVDAGIDAIAPGTDVPTGDTVVTDTVTPFDAALPGCGTSDWLIADRFTDADIRMTNDLVYGSDGETIDLYVPDPARDGCLARPILVMVHGGGWTIGQKEWLDARARFYARRGMVVATLDYRLTTVPMLCDTTDGWARAVYRAAQDIQASIQFVAARSAIDASDSNSVFLYGNSAGSVTSLSLALATQAQIDATYPWLRGEQGALDAISTNRSQTYNVRGVFAQAGAILSPDWLMRAAGESGRALLLMHSEGDRSVPFQVGSSEACASLTSLRINGSGWIRDQIAANPALDGCTAVLQVRGDIHDLDEVYGERCGQVSPPCRPSRMDDTATHFFAQVLGGRCDTQSLTCDTTSCTLTRGTPRETLTLFP